MINFAYGIGLAVGVGLSGVAFGIFSGACAAFLGVPLVLWFVGNAIRQGIIVGESTVLAIPLVGWVYERISPRPRSIPSIPQSCSKMPCITRF